MMGAKKIVEGYVYEYCHPDDCHSVLLPRRLSEEEIKRIAEDKLSWLREDSKRKEIEEHILPSFRDNVIEWEVFWDALDKEAVVPCRLLEELKGRKVRITIEVIE